MKRLNGSTITNTSQLPIKKGTLDFIQDAHKETLAALIIGIIGTTYDSTKIYILRGCVNSTSPPYSTNGYNISAGSIFINGEVFEVAGASFTPSGANLAGFVPSQTFYTTNADPVTFTDGASRSVHEINAYVINEQGPLYTYTFDNAIRLYIDQAVIKQYLTDLKAAVDLINGAWTSQAVTTANFKAYNPSDVQNPIVGTVGFTCRYKIMGKTLYIAMFGTVTIPNNTRYLALTLPQSKTWNNLFQGITVIRFGTTSNHMAQFVAEGGSSAAQLRIYDIVTSTNLPNGDVTLGGEMIGEIN